MAFDFSELQATPAHMGHLDFSSLGAIPAVGGMPEEETSALGAAGRGAIGMLPLGKQAYAGIESLVDKTPYVDERKELEKDIESDIANHPTARLAGQAAGVVAPAVLTGGASIPGGAVAEGALYGAGFGAGNAIDTLASGGSGGKAAEEAILGTAAGAVGGAAGKALGNVIAKVAKPFVNSQDELFAEATAGILGGTTRQIRSLPGKNPVETLIKMGRDMARYKVNGEPLVAMADQMPARLNKFIALQEQAGKTIGDTIKAANVPPMPIKPIEEELASALKFATPDDQAQLQAVIGQVRAYAEKNDAIPFERLQLLKGELGDRAFQGQGNPVLQSAYHVVSDVQDRELEKVASTINKPEFDAAKNAYQLTSRAIPMLRMSVAKEVGGKTNLLIPGAALLAGHPAVAAGALMKNRLAQMGSGAMFKGVQALPENAGAVVANLPGKMGGQVAGAAVQQNMGETKPLPGHASPAPKHEIGHLNMNHPAMAPWRPMFQKNAMNAKNPGEVEKANAVTDFVLSQRDPAYSAAKKRMADEPMSEPVKMADGGFVDHREAIEPGIMGETEPPEQKAINALNAIGAGYGMGQLGGMAAEKGFNFAKNLGEAGAIFPKTEQAAVATPPKASAFDRWFNGSKVVDEAGVPKTLYHGTTHEFEAFDPAKANPENALGKGIYLTDSAKDVNANYAGEGPDLTNRLTIRAEQLADELGGTPKYGTPEYKAFKESMKQKAREELEVGAPRTMPLYARMKKPISIGGSGETEFSLDDRSMDRLYKAVQKTADANGLDGQKIWGELTTKTPDYMKASELHKAVQESPSLMDFMDDAGNIASGEFERQVYQNMGYDGAVMDADTMFGAGRRIGQQMAMDPGTKHYVVFKPTAVKSAIGNRGTFSLRDPNITHTAPPLGLAAFMGAKKEGMAGGGVIDPLAANRDKIEPGAMGETEPPEMKALKALNDIGMGYGMGELGGGILKKGYTVAKDLGEAGTIFPKPSYKTPETFAKNTFYHATPASNAEDIIANGFTPKTGELTGRISQDIPKGTFLYPGKGSATYGNFDAIENAKEFGRNLKEPRIIASELEGKVLHTKLSPKELTQDLVDHARTKGYVAIKGEEQGIPFHFVFEPSAIKVGGDVTDAKSVSGLFESLTKKPLSASTQNAPKMEEVPAGGVEAYVKGIQKGPNGDVKIWGVKGPPELLKKHFGDEAPGSVPEHILREKGILPEQVDMSRRNAPNNFARGGTPFNSGMADQLKDFMRKRREHAEPR